MKKKLSKSEIEKIVADTTKEREEAEWKENKKSLFIVIFIIVGIIIFIIFNYVNKEPEKIIEPTIFKGNKELFEKTCISKGYRKPTFDDMEKDPTNYIKLKEELGRCMIKEFKKINNIDF